MVKCLTSRLIKQQTKVRLNIMIYNDVSCQDIHFFVACTMLACMNGHSIPVYSKRDWHRELFIGI